LITRGRDQPGRAFTFLGRGSHDAPGKLM